MSDHLIAEADRHAMALPTTQPTHADIAWYVREVSELRAEVEESKARERAAIASWDEERQRALREGGRVVELRAELALLREWQREVIQNANAHHAELKEAIARAESAEREVERLRAGIGECLRANAHLADGEDCTLIGLKRCLHDSGAARAEAATAELLDALDNMARQNCHTGKVDRDYNGQVAGSLVTDSGALSAEAEALEVLAAHGRFRIVAGGGRMIVGYWPENDPTVAPH